MLLSDLTSPRYTHVYCIDASEWGVGACRASFAVDEVRAMGQLSERWRFRSEAALLGARAHASFAHHHREAGESERVAASSCTSGFERRPDAE